MKEGSSKNRFFIFLISLLTASTFWFYVLNSEPLVVERQVPVVFLNPPGMASLTVLPKKIDVKLRGSRSFVQSLKFESDKVYIDLKKYNYKKATFVVDFKKSMIPLPFGISVVDILPTQTMVSLEKEIKKKVPIRPEYVGSINPNLKLVKKELKPSEFMISGPISIMRKIGVLRTLPYDLSTIEGDEGTVKLTMAPTNPLIKVLDNKEIFLNYVFKPNKANMTLKNIPISFLTSRPSFSSRIKKVAIDVLVSDEEKVKELKKSSVKVIAELPGRRGRKNIKLKAVLPEGVHLLQIHPESINVQVK